MIQKHPFPFILTNSLNPEFPDAKGYFWCLIWAGVGILEHFSSQTTMLEHLRATQKAVQCGEGKEAQALKASQLGFDFWFHHLLASHLISQCLSFLIC